MKNIYFTVGPTQVYETYEKHMFTAMQEEIPSLSHRGQEFKDLYKHTIELLREIFGFPPHFHVFFTGSSLESMERIIQNTVRETSYHVITGSFGKRFFQTAESLKKKPIQYAVPDGQGWNGPQMKIPKSTELIALTQNDTSTGVVLPMEEIYAVKDSHPHAFIAIDIVSSAPYTLVDWDKIDLGFFSVQKGFGLPAGLGVLLVSEKAVEKARTLQKEGVNIGSFHNFVELGEKAAVYQTPETPNVLNIYLLAKVCEDLLKKGMPTIRTETEEKGRMMLEFFAKKEGFSPFVKEEKYRSITSLVIDTGGRTTQIAKSLAAKGIVIGKGYGAYKDTHIRLANFPSQRIEHVEKLLKALQNV